MDTTTTKQLVLVDVALTEHYQRGQRDFERGLYNPPPGYGVEFEQYLRGANDAWAKANNRTLLR